MGKTIGGEPHIAGTKTLIATPVIVIFGAAVRPDGSPSLALRRRVEAAIRFGSGLQRPLYLPTGAAGLFGPPEARVMAQLLHAHGITDAQILREETGTSTLTSVCAVARMLRERGFREPVYAASSAYHLPRCVVLLRMAGFAAKACPPPDWPEARLWRIFWYWRLREVLALPVDVVVLTWLRIRRQAGL